MTVDAFIITIISSAISTFIYIIFAQINIGLNSNTSKNKKILTNKNKKLLNIPTNILPENNHKISIEYKGNKFNIQYKFPENNNNKFKDAENNYKPVTFLFDQFIYQQLKTQI
jgi:hypothetical protein